MVPLMWLLTCTLTAGFQKIFDANPKVGFLAHAAKYQMAIDKGQLLAPADSMQQMTQIIFNDRVDAVLALFFISVVVLLFFWGVFVSWRAFNLGRKDASDELLPGARTHV